MRWLGKLLDGLFLSENTCKVCGRPFSPQLQGYICPSCISSLSPHEYFKNPKELEGVDGYEFFQVYEGTLREIIILYKFKSVKPFGLEIAKLIKPHFEEFMKKTGARLVTFVPVHFLRRYTRGYDHNEEVIRNLKIPFAKVLKRTRYARPLAGKSPEERRKATEKAYTVTKPWLVKGKDVLVYDDILTTGSTAMSVARALRSAGARKVYFYFLAVEG
ncbi:MAG: ComF family protein [Aquificae bacterium]|nr:ComF family protein [Aquificota bacterium]